jgi:hypothetical protein
VAVSRPVINPSSSSRLGATSRLLHILISGCVDFKLAQASVRLMLCPC